MDSRIYLMGVIWLIYSLVLLPLFIGKEKRLGHLGAVKYKLSLSAAFCLVGLIGVIRQNAGSFTLLVFFGLIFSLLGDYYLIFIKTDIHKFMKGIYFFSAAQIFYIKAISEFTGFQLMEFLIAAAVILPILFLKDKLKLDMGKARLPLNVYIILVTFMTIKAILMLFQVKELNITQELFAAGAVLFFLSDSFLGIWRFIKSKQEFSYIIYLCYFIGQLMIATSAFCYR